MGGRANWEELVSRLLLKRELRVCSNEESSGSAVGSGAVPSSLFQSDINDILAAADQVHKYPPLGPLVSRILYEHAYSLSQQMDPNSRGRGVLQFKTGLKAIIKNKNLKDGGHTDPQYNIELLQKFYAFYREEHKVEELIRQQSTNTRTENMRIVFATLKVIRDILKARREEIPIKFQAILESDVEKEIKPYNILPLETPGISDDKMQTFEMKAAITTLLYTRDLPRLPVAFLKPKGRELDILDLLQFCFGFQVDNVNNQREHLILLLVNRQMRLGSLHDNNLLLDEEAINQVYYKFTQNYEEWCKYVMTKSIYSSRHRIKRPIKQMNLLLLALFALIWGEAANLRFLPECLCYIFHNMAEDLYEILDMEDAKRAKTWIDCEHPFLEQVIVPVYKIIAEEATNNKEGKAPHTIWRNYDDFNEYFWSSDCFQLNWPWNMNDVFFSCIKPKKKPETYEESEAQPQYVNKKRGGKVLFVEHRTFLHVYHSFHRLWVLLVVLLQAMTIIAFTGKSYTLWKRLLSLGPTYFIMKFFQVVLDARLLYGAYSTTHKANIYRIYAQVAWFGASSGSLAFLYIKGFNSSPLMRLYILLLALYAAYNVFVSILMRIPYFYQLADQCGNGYIIRFVKWVNQEQFFVGRGMYESTIDYLSYVAFWVLVLAAKFVFSYYMQIKPLVKPTQFIVKLRGIHYTWHDFISKKNHNSLSVFWIWAPVILIYFLDIQIWYTIASAFVGGINGARSHIGEIRTLAVVRKRFRRLPKDFVSKLVPKNFHWQIGSTLSNKKNYLEKEIEAIQFVPFWNEIIHSLRDEDYISNRERDLLLMPSNNEGMGVIQWPLFLVANKVETSVKVAIDYANKKDFSEKLGVTSKEQKDLWDKLDKDYTHDAIQEAYYGVSNMLKKLVQDMHIPKTWLNSFFTDVDSLVRNECLLSKFQMEVLPDILFNIRPIVKALTQDHSAERAKQVWKNLQNLHEIITKQGLVEKDELPNNKSETAEWMENCSEHLKWPSENERSQVKRLYRLLSIESSTMDIPRNLEAQRRLTFFTNSLCMQMPDAPPVQKMLSFSVFTPYYHEDVLYSKKQLREKNEDNISTLFYLQNIYPDEWKNFLERIGSEENKVMKQLEEDKLDLMELRLWASYRGQTLARTVRGMMYYHKTVMLQSYFEKIATQDIEKNLSHESWQDYHSTRDASAQAALKFIYVVSCQQYGQQKQNKDPKVADIKYLMQKNDAMRVAHIDIVETLDKNNRIHKEFYSKLVKTDPSGREQEIYSIKLPGNFKIGEGKPENQNHAIIFTRGDAIQTIDMNQDNYFEEALKMRNLLEEFDINNGIRKPSILGLREHVFTGSISSLAKFMRNQETSFVTLGQRVLANPLKARMHYGHPDVFDRVFHLTRGGISKASRVINISEDIYAGFNSTLRQGSITHHEYIQVGKGRDVGLNQIALFEAKVSSGNGEQMLSRDVYRLGNLLDFFRMMSFFYTSVGYYICTLMTVWTVYAFLYGRAYLALSGVEKDMIRQADILNNTSLQTVLNAQFLYQIGIFTAIPMIVCFILEEGLLKAIINFLTMQFELCTIFFTFSLGTRSHYFGRTILHGGAKYRATGRGFVVQRIHFTENYRLFSRSHFVKGAEIIILLIVYMAYGSSKSATSYILLMFTSWFLALSWMFAPYIFNPSGFEWNKTTDDFKNWTDWLFAKGVNMKEEESWEKWWDEEQAHIRSFGSSICETILSLRFFFFQYGVVYHLGAANGSTKLTVYGISWLVLLGILLLLKVMTTSNKGSTNFQLFLRFFQGTTSLVVLAVVIVAVVKTSLTTTDVFATALALIPTCWGIICIGIAWKSMFKFLGLWKTIRALARAYDAALGTAIFAPIIILSWFPVVSTFLTRLMFNTAFSRGLEVSAILGGKEGLAESHPILKHKPYIVEKK